MRAVILQPSYIPWRGYFHLIQRADVFVFYDDVQYDKHGWRNRNRIKTQHGSQWLTIPVAARGNVTEGLRLCDVQMLWQQNWAKKHWASVAQAYAKAPHFREYEPLLANLYRFEPTTRPANLVDYTIATTQHLAAILGITHTRFVRSSELNTSGEKTDRLIAILKAIDADHYISGPSARRYIDAKRFADANIKLEYVEYNYAEYTQLHPPFDGQVSILDLLFHLGNRAADHIWGPLA